MCTYEGFAPVYFLVLSNIPGWLAAYRLYTYRFYVLCVVFIFSPLVSALYHAAGSQCIDILGMDANTWGVADFWLAFSSIIAVTVLLAHWSLDQLAYQAAHLLFLMVVMLLLVLRDRTSGYTIMVISVLMALFIFCKFALVDHRLPRCVSWFNLTCTLLCGALGISLFFVSGSIATESYWWVHSLWHGIVYLAPCFAVDIYNPYRRFWFWRKSVLDSHWHFKLRVLHPWDWHQATYCGAPALKSEYAAQFVEFQWEYTAAPLKK